MTLKDLEPQLAALSRAEKAQALQLLARDIADSWPGVEKTPGIIGGDACIVRTRIPVWVLENYRQLGWSEARLLENFPALRAADLVAPGLMPTLISLKLIRPCKATLKPSQWPDCIRTKTFLYRWPENCAHSAMMY